MLVCICKGLSEHKVQGVIDAGADTVEAIGAACGAGTDCGACHEELTDLIDAADVARGGRHAAPVRAGCRNFTPEATHEGQRPDH